MERGFATINDGNIKRVALLQPAPQSATIATGSDSYFAGAATGTVCFAAQLMELAPALVQRLHYQNYTTTGTSSTVMDSHSTKIRLSKSTRSVRPISTG
jgi:hypothetical protein